MPHDEVPEAWDELLSRQELADRLKRHVCYVDAMIRLGFRMIGGRSTLRLALLWLSENPNPRSRKPKRQAQAS